MKQRDAGDSGSGSANGEKVGDRTRHAILAAAQAEFVARGFSATSTSRIAAAAGVTKSLIHHHFGSKQELWNSVKALVMEDYGRAQQRLIDARVPDLTLLRDSIVTYFRFLQDHPDVVRLWTWMQVEEEHACADITKKLSESAVAVIARAQRAGHVRSDVDAEMVLAQFFVLVRGWFGERALLQADLLAGKSAVSCDERYLKGVLKVFLDGLRAK